MQGTSEISYNNYLGKVVDGTVVIHDADGKNELVFRLDSVDHDALKPVPFVDTELNAAKAKEKVGLLNQLAKVMGESWDAHPILLVLGMLFAFPLTFAIQMLRAAIRKTKHNGEIDAKIKELETSLNRRMAAHEAKERARVKQVFEKVFPKYVTRYEKRMEEQPKAPLEPSAPEQSAPDEPQLQQSPGTVPGLLQDPFVSANTELRLQRNALSENMKVLVLRAQGMDRYPQAVQLCDAMMRSAPDGEFPNKLAFMRAANDLAYLVGENQLESKYRPKGGMVAYAIFPSAVTLEQIYDQMDKSQKEVERATHGPRISMDIAGALNERLQNMQQFSLQRQHACMVDMLNHRAQLTR